MLTDTHSHIYAEEFDSDRDEVIARAEKAGVGLILLPAIDRESYDRQEQLAESRPDLFRQMMGLHPTSVGENYTTDLELVNDKLFSNPDKYIGVGEIGLDFYWDTTYRNQQLEVLERQIGWAQELDKPIVLHLRNGKDGNSDNDAYDAVFKLLERLSRNKYKGIMHCFSGTMEDAERAVDMGFCIGIGGTLTYKKSSLPEIVKALPLERIVLETDDPYLAPVPYRGRRNEPSYITFVAEKVAEIKNISSEKVADVTTANAKELFNL
ncbi:MAG: TatD family hydrolase [Bacteroidales bacterium]|nr:TatD family hydrolase [Bacteroidales bacterium]